MVSVRTLQPGDEAALETFLCQYTETSMFLRSNLRAAGLVDGGAQFQGTYVAAVEDEMILAVAAHYWNGMIVVQAPIHLQAVVRQLIPAFLTKSEKTGVKNCENIYCKRIPAV